MPPRRPPAPRCALAAALAAVAFLLLVAGPAAALCRRVSHEGRGYAVCEAVAGEDALRLWLGDGGGTAWGSFERLNAGLAAAGQRLGFAMNAGMFHADLRPVGLYVEDGRTLAPLVTAAGPGNFGMLPNGVFCILTGGFAVVESRAFAARPLPCRHATQSGPMLVIAGRLHPRFLADATSRHIRNGVGVSADGRRAVFAIAETPVTFHEFGRLFRDGLGLGQALYLDGAVSRLHAPALGLGGGGLRPVGPIVGTLVPAAPAR
ncbi:MAG: phosphodiester glycosidase family protein [Rhodobacteraceae bacterium]|nr:phosphodiester glycosidase family protein [Paracoccaceae bacterium]